MRCSCPSHTPSAGDIRSRGVRSAPSESTTLSPTPQSQPDIPSRLASASVCTNADDKASFFPYLREQVAAELSVKLHLQVQYREKKPKETSGTEVRRLHVFPHKDVKETIFFFLFFPPPVFKVLIGSINKTSTKNLFNQVKCVFKKPLQALTEL